MINENSNYVRLQDNLEYLKLKQIALHLDEVTGPESVSLSFIDGLLRLTDYEVDIKRKNVVNSMISVAGFPQLKDIHQFDFDFQPTLDKKKIMALLDLGFVERQENIVFLGSSGVGKTHLAIALGIESASHRYSTYFIKCSQLLENLRKAQAENRLEQRLKFYSRYKLLIIDELGYLPLNPGDARLLFQIIDRRYEYKSTIVTTNINFSDWDTLFDDPLIANAILDRILHHATVIHIVGESYRLKDYSLQEEGNKENIR